MNKPKLESEKHPSYPKAHPIEWSAFTSMDWSKYPPSVYHMHTYKSDPTWVARYQSFMQAHPEFNSEGEYQLQCPSCGDESNYEWIDQGGYCCGEVGHCEWVYVENEDL